MIGILKAVIDTIAVSYILLVLLTTNVAAESCDLTDPSFPSPACSFTGVGVNIQSLKFGFVDSVFGTNVRFGSAVYELAESITIYDVFGGGVCIVADEDDLDIIDPNDEVAFITSPSDPRQIIIIWDLTCSLVQDR